MSRLMKIIGTVAIINILARLLSFVREMAIAKQYGTNYEADAIVAAYTIPNFIYLVVGGAFTTAFISVYHVTKTNSTAYVKRIFTLVGSLAIAVTVLSLFFTTPLMRLMVNSEVEGSLALTRQLFYWMMPSTIFLILSTWLSGLLNVHNQFRSSSTGIFIYNLLFLLLAVVGAYWIGPVAYGIAALLAAIGMAFYLWREAKREASFRMAFSFGWNEDIRSVLIIALPILFGGATMQFYFVIHRIVAAQLEEGVVSAVNYASKLTSFPQAIMMTAVTTVIYPMLSKKVSEGAHGEVNRLYKKGLLYLFALLIPATAFAYFLAEPLVKLVFASGNFAQHSLQLTVPLFQYFALSMFFLAANTFITRFYYAKGNSIIPVIFSLLTVFGVNLGVIYWTIEQWGALSIALGTVVSAAANFALLMVYYEWKLKKL